MGVGSGGQGGVVAPFWIFKHDTDKVKTGLQIVLFFGLVFSVARPFWKFFCRRPWWWIKKVEEGSKFDLQQTGIKLSALITL